MIELKPKIIILILFISQNLLLQEKRQKTLKSNNHDVITFEDTKTLRIL